MSEQMVQRNSKINRTLQGFSITGAILPGLLKITGVEDQLKNIFFTSLVGSFPAPHGLKIGEQIFSLWSLTHTLLVLNSPLIHHLPWEACCR
ncbi:MAG TPA: hypothetical protein VK469_05190 [Candidatus Kapabacteria bacterium]|nr:hypothetical protein [Candidatus Kapabacteria bacterium]